MKSNRVDRARTVAVQVGCGLIVLLASAVGSIARADQCDRAACDCPSCQEFLQGCPSIMTPSAESATAPTQPMPSTDSAVAPDSSLTQPSPMSSDMSSLTAPTSTPAMPSPSSLASSMGGAGGNAGIPDMIGDFFGGGYNYAFVNNATVATAGGDRRMKLADNNSPFPRDRVFFNYHHFHNSLTDVIGRDADLDRYTFGVEKTFLDQLLSLELRVPFAGALGANPGGDDPIGRVTEFGNMSLVAKGLLYRDECSAISTGLGIVFPTGDDFSVELSGIIDNTFRNEAVHLQPFIGVYRATGPRAFHQGFLQFDFDAGGNRVEIGGVRDRLTDAPIMFVDYSFGYWLRQDSRARWLRGVAPMLELHYSTSIDDQNYGAFSTPNSFVGQIFVNDPRRDVLNITGGIFFQLTRQSTLKVGCVSPLRDGSDKLFDSEIGVQFARRF